MRVEAQGSRDEGRGLMIESSRLKFEDSGFYGPGLRVEGLVCKVRTSGRAPSREACSPWRASTPPSTCSAPAPFSFSVQVQVEVGGLGV